MHKVNGSNILNDVLTFREASQIWKLCDSTLRKMVKTDKLIEGIDFRKSGSTWLITNDAMIKVYGKSDI